jgi:hypothetical protein
MVENQQSHRVSPVPVSDAKADGNAKMDKMIDLNLNPQRMHEHGSNNQVRLMTHPYIYYLSFILF